MIASTRSLVWAATSVRPFITFETVGTDTPASTAMSAMVIFPDTGPPAAEGSAFADMPAVYGSGLPFRNYRRLFAESGGQAAEQVSPADQVHDEDRHHR